MRSLATALARTFSNRIESAGGWSNTTYNRKVSTSTVQSRGTKEMEAYGAVSTLFAIINKISNSTGSVKWRMYRPTTDGRKVQGPNEIDRPEIVKHVALDLWKNPNPFYTSSLFVEASQQYIDLCGECFWILGRSPLSTMPLELWIVRPDKMEVVPSAEDFIAGYVYKDPNDEKIPLEVDQVIHIKMPNPMDPYRGLGPVQALMTDLQAVAAAAQYNRNFFTNDASPGGVIEMDVRLSDAEWNEFVERWRSQHQGVNNAHRVATLEQGAKWKDVGFSMRDMQFSELRSVSREVIREAFAMHGHMLGLTEDINRANAEAAEDVFARWTLVPRLDRIKDALNHQLLPLFGSSGQGVEFDFDDPSLENSEATAAMMLSQAQSAKTIVEAGGEFNSVLEAVGLPEIEFDQAKVDREEKAKQDQADALKQSGGPDGQKPAESNGKAPAKDPVPA
jgi:HK97 family phage portal protein